MSIFKVFGWLTVAFGVVALFGVVANLKGKTFGGHSLAPFAGVAVLSILVGVGLLFHRKWAAVSFAVLLSCAGFWMGIMSVVRVPMPWLILNFSLACVLLVPSALVVFRWSELKGK
jgi:hypothetical protein